MNGQYTVWGRVTQGMAAVDRIMRGEPPRDPDRIIRLRVAADVKE
ncbi:MAG: peptidylprolyl isomerase [Alphaproteobacteria bacterium]